MINKIRKIFRSIEPETWVTIIFVVSSAFASANKPYLLLIVLYLIGLYLVSKNLATALWISFLTVFLFFRAKYFVSFLSIPNDIAIQINRSVIATYFIAYSDGLLAMLLYVLLRQRDKWQLKIGKDIGVWLIMLALVTLGLISAWNSVYPNVAFFYLWQLGKLFIVFMLTRLLTVNRRILKLTLATILVFVGFNGLLIILQGVHHGPVGLPIESLNSFREFGVYADESQSVYRPGGITTSPNEMASVLGMALPLLLVLGFCSKKVNQFMIWGLLLITIVALILTAARIVWIVSLITSIVGWWCIRKKYELSITGQRIVILLALIVGVIFLPFILNRLGSLNKTIDIDNGGLTYRWRHVLVARDIMINNPIGVGLNVFQYSMLNNYEPRFYMNDPTPAHNILAEIGADLGVLGLVLFVFLYYKLFARKLEMLNTVRIKRAFDPILIGTFLSMISYLLISQAHPWLLSAPVAYVFWILAGLNHYEV